MMVICIKQHLSNMKNLSNAEAELEKSVAYIKKRVFQVFFHFHTNLPFLYPQKMIENQRFSDMFRWYRKGTLASNRSKDP